MERIASLLPSTTEIACALGFEASLVGRSHECDFPPSVAALPPLTSPKLDASAPSRTIDGRVKQLVQGGLSVYRVDAERLRELAPSVILTQDQCQVCAASLADVEEALGAWLGARPRVVSLNPSSLDDVQGDLLRVAEALAAPQQGVALAEEFSGRIDAVAERSLRIRERPTVASIEWIDPLMTAGNWMPELVTLAGGRNLFGETGHASPWLDWETLRAADPEVIVLLPCGFDLARTRRELPPLLAQPGWAELRAVKAGRVLLTDGNQYFNRPGPRLAESLEILAEILHPEEFPPLHRGRGWEPLQPEWSTE
jgi:iron complex transport system substrate-binding protein